MRGRQNDSLQLVLEGCAPNATGSNSEIRKMSNNVPDSFCLLAYTATRNMSKMAAYSRILAFYGEGCGKIASAIRIFLRKFHDARHKQEHYDVGDLGGPARQKYLG